MSYDLTVYGPSPLETTRATWQRALEEASPRIDLPPGVDPVTWTGGLVALGPGTPPPGFILVRRPLDPGEVDPVTVGTLPPDVAVRLAVAAAAWDLSAPLTAEPSEWNPLWLAAGALASAVDGVLWDPQARTFTPAPSAMAIAQAAVENGPAAAAAAPVPTPWGPLPRSVAEERAREQNLPPPGRFTVELLAASGNHPALIRTVGDALGVGIGRARAALRDPPLVLITLTSRTYADVLVSRLAGFGATAVVR